jgi:hypothetical protein
VPFGYPAFLVRRERSVTVAVGLRLIEEIESAENIIRCPHSLFRRMAAEWNVNHEYHFATD